ncbi:MAG: pirin family protein [Bacteroidetes bacterium]|nr:MAG: pirin family protein [Bacteroidota bacterium]
MNRKNFFRQALLGTAATLGGRHLLGQSDFSSSSTYDKLMAQVGFNRLPNEEVRPPKTVLHRADTRGHANHGWLDSHHSFSFANYYNPERVHFGVLRVLNDDYVAAGQGFGSHPHDNMEIISIPLEGDLEHQDSMGNKAVIRAGDVQVMSAGTGVYHSEYNKNADQPVKFLQIWVFPRERGVTPRYDQITLPADAPRNQLQQVLSPHPDDAGVWIHQDAWFYIGEFDAGQGTTYTLKKPGNGVYAFVLEGDFTLGGQDLHRRDGLGIWDVGQFELRAESDARILLMEVPMSV